MKHSAILPIIFLCIPIILPAMEPDTGQTPPPDWDPDGSEALHEWLDSQGDGSLIMSAESEIITIKTDLSWKSTTSVAEDPGCPADPSFSPDWTQVGFDDGSWSSSRLYSYSPYYGIDPTLGTMMIWVAGNYSPPGGPTLAYFRHTFTLDNPVSSAIAALGVDDNFQFYVNGHLVYDDHGYGGSVEGPFDITNYLQTGQNVFAIRAWDGGYCSIYDRLYNAVAFLAEIETETAPVSFEIEMLDGKYFSVGTDITDEPERLVEGGNPVLGAVADGVTRILLRATVSEPGVANYSIQGSGETDEDGTLYVLGGFQEGRYISVGSISMDQGERVFAIYKAPKNFVRAGYTYDDESKSERSLTIECEFVPNDPSKEPVLLEKEIKIVRPPILLIHGLWGKPADWYENGFYDMLNEQWQGADLTVIDYEATNDRSFIVNKGVVNRRIQRIKDFYISPGSLIAITQVDVVGHSMGGLLAREWAGKGDLYERKDNFKQGDIHKLITINSSHNGSFLADAAINALFGPRSWYLNFILDRMESRGMSVSGGAVVDMRTTSRIIESINSTQIIPFCHSIIGFYENVHVHQNPDSSYTISGIPYFSYYGLHNSLQNNGYDIHLDILNSDLVISCESQRGGLGQFASKQFLHHHMNWQTEPVARHVIGLLNAGTDVYLYFEQGFPVRN